jgi:hypothetical protein
MVTETEMQSPGHELNRMEGPPSMQAPVTHPVPVAGDGETRPFWQVKALDALNDAEWESLCDGCGRCCLNKLEDEDTGEIYWTDVACRLLDHHTCRCGDYANRWETVPDCVKLDPTEVQEQRYTWLPPTCAYRLIAAGQDLYWWHPLVSGDPDTVHAAGISVRGRVVSELDYHDEMLEDRITDWPGQGIDDGR